MRGCSLWPTILHRCTECIEITAGCVSVLHSACKDVRTFQGLSGYRDPFACCPERIKRPVACSNYTSDYWSEKMWGQQFSTVFLAVGLVSVAKGEDTIGCFNQGECLQSLFIAVNSTDTAEQCLEICKVRTKWAKTKAAKLNLGVWSQQWNFQLL